MSQARRQRRLAKKGVAADLRLEIIPGSVGGSETAAEALAGHLDLFERYAIRLAEELTQKTKQGHPLADCVGVIVQTDDDPDLVGIVPVKVGMEIAQEASSVFHDEIARPPGAGMIRVLIHTPRATSVRTVRAVPLVAGGKA